MKLCVVSLLSAHGTVSRGNSLKEPPVQKKHLKTLIIALINLYLHLSARTRTQALLSSTHRSDLSAVSMHTCNRANELSPHSNHPFPGCWSQVMCSLFTTLVCMMQQLLKSQTGHNKIRISFVLPSSQCFICKLGDLWEGCRGPLGLMEKNQTGSPAPSPQYSKHFSPLGCCHLPAALPSLSSLTHLSGTSLGWYMTSKILCSPRVVGFPTHLQIWEGHKALELLQEEIQAGPARKETCAVLPLEKQGGMQPLEALLQPCWERTMLNRILDPKAGHGLRGRSALTLHNPPHSHCPARQRQGELQFYLSLSPVSPAGEPVGLGTAHISILTMAGTHKHTHTLQSIFAALHAHGWH